MSVLINVTDNNEQLVDQFSDRLAALETRIELLKRQLETKDNRIATLERQLERKDERIADLKCQLDVYDRASRGNRPSVPKPAISSIGFAVRKLALARVTRRSWSRE